MRFSVGAHWNGFPAHFFKQKLLLNRAFWLLKSQHKLSPYVVKQNMSLGENLYPYPYPPPPPPSKNSSDLGHLKMWTWSWLGGPDPWTSRPATPLETAFRAVNLLLKSLHFYKFRHELLFPRWRLIWWSKRTSLIFPMIMMQSMKIKFQYLCFRGQEICWN